jgi:hypothetical protein
MVKTTLYLETDTLQVLEQLANAQGRSQAEIIREALAVYTERGPRPALKGIGAYRSGRSDVSERAEDLLREAARGSR